MTIHSLIQLVCRVANRNDVMFGASYSIDHSSISWQTAFDGKCYAMVIVPELFMRWSMIVVLRLRVVVLGGVVVFFAVWSLRTMESPRLRGRRNETTGGDGKTSFISGYFRTILS